VRRPVDRLERRIARTVAGPTRDAIGKRIAVTVRIVVDPYISATANAAPAIRRDGCFDGGVEDRTTDRDSDAMLAGVVVVLVSGARTVSRNAIDDLD